MLIHNYIIKVFFFLGAVLLATQVIATETSNIKEYGIVILLEDKCTKKAQELNRRIGEILDKLKNVDNHLHVTLYHGASNLKDLAQIYRKIQQLSLKPFTLNLDKIYSTADRWIDLGIEKTDYLQKIHNHVVAIASPYHKRPLARSSDAYQDVTDVQRRQIDDYGVGNVLEFYNPHMTLFYQYPPNAELREAIISIRPYCTLMVCKASKIVIGELGYNGNIKKIIYSVDIPD
ncbi:MAG: hypothetical protein EOP33_02665 [Rickettsiaceae bacterium]|nr:MAG: hypothetical protein EOP33_02665 [Rickettsiaceae bacterium]